MKTTKTNDESTRFRHFVASLPHREGENIVFCPKCRTLVRRERARINALNAYAYTDGVSLVWNGTGCCF